MGSLRDSTDKSYPLRARTRVGRAADNDVVVPTTSASSVHASIEWRGGGSWELKDLGSRNGTFLNGERIESGAWRRLEPRAVLAFGTPELTWTVEDLDRPQAEAKCRETGDVRFSTDHILTLNEDPNDWADVVEDVPGSWVLELRGRCDPVADQQTIEVGGNHWTLTLPTAEPRTEPIGGAVEAVAADVRMRFRVSADLEHVQVLVTFKDLEWASSRAYARALLELANARLRDRDQGGHPEEHGWLYADDLCAQAGYESESRLNVEIHRARREFARAGLPNAATLVQRRRGTRQIRIGTAALEVEFLRGRA